MLALLREKGGGGAAAIVVAVVVVVAGHCHFCRHHRKRSFTVVAMVGETHRLQYYDPTTSTPQFRKCRIDVCALTM
jgi:hypothetical protein